MKSGQVYHTLIQAFVFCNQRQNIQRHYLADTGAFRTHPVRIVKGEVRGGSDMRLAYPAVKQPQGSVHVADGSYGGAGISAQAGLVNHNGGRQVFDFVCPWLFELGQPAPDKGRIVFLSGFQGKYFSGCSGTTLVSQCCFDMTYHGSFFLLIFSYQYNKQQKKPLDFFCCCKCAYSYRTIPNNTNLALSNS